MVVTSYNYATVLPWALDSVLTQTLADWELIVVDDGSTNSSRHISQAFADAHPHRKVTLLFTRNGGLGRARNLGISVARGRYITCLDADDYFSPTALERLSAALDREQSADVARPFLQSFGVEEGIWEYPEYDFDASTSVNQAPYCAMFRRTAWQRVGGYHEGMPAYEDWNFWITLGEYGSHMTRVAEPLLHYRTSTDGMFARHRGRDLVLRATIVAEHPKVYDAASQNLAERILAGEEVDAELATGTPHAIFNLSYHARTLRGEDISTDFGAVT
ncbi:glycosyltransferase family A protein [Streptomyces sp. NPDC005706]|uniref:glycosyltransferase family A protein n=1 Tax=Streptomyces sp. NPDC005706 TaxID=3157169 RepID=UPI0033C9393E